MKIGDQLVVKEKFGGLIKGIKYYFLCSIEKINRVRLVVFQESKSGYTAKLISMPRDDFEEGLVDGKIIHAKVQLKFPVWLSELEGIDISFLEQSRRSTVKTYLEYVHGRYSVIHDAICKREEILKSENPNRMLNGLALQQNKKQNPSRFKLWFFAYTLFSDNVWVLMPEFSKIGGWDREAWGQKNRFGRRDQDGAPALFNADSEMKKKIRSGFRRYGGSHESRQKTYRKVLVEVFGCKAIIDEVGSEKFIHPNSVPFPSIDQFNYWVSKIFDEKDIREHVKGKYAAKARSGHAGKFSEGLSSVYEKVEFDGYYLYEKAVSLDGETGIPAFCVVKAVCVLSGAILGVGFARGAESLEAYKMALFSMAINKDKFQSLFGYKSTQEWPCEGLGPDVIADRGPGAALNIKFEHFSLSALELTPSESGQSKATVESSHRRNKKVPDDKGHFQSKLDYIRLAKREIAKAIAHNHSSDASARLTPRMWQEEFAPTPHNIWSYFSLRGRTSARAITFENAVRNFLALRSVTIKRDGIYLEGFNYFSRELESAGLFDYVARNGSISANAYVMNMCVRHIWLEYRGVIYELSARYPIRVVDEEKFITIFELEDLAKIRAKTKSEHRRARPAAHEIAEQDFYESTGEKMDSGERKAGRYKRTVGVRRAEASQKRLQGR